MLYNMCERGIHALITLVLFVVRFFVRGRHLAAVIVVAVATLTTSAANGQTIIYVHAEADLGGDGESWGTALRFLRDAIRVAGDATGSVEIWVVGDPNGFTYYPDEFEDDPPMDPPNDTDERADSFELGAFKIYGGFAGDEEELEERDPATYITILSADLTQNDSGGLGDNTRLENSYHVVTASDDDATPFNCWLDGFTIIGGNADNGLVDEGVEGGGIPHLRRRQPAHRQLPHHRQ